MPGPSSVKLVAAPALDTRPDTTAEFGGRVGERISANVDHWLLTAPEANPAMLQIMRDRDRTPRRDLVPWAGEFSGKYLTAGVGALRTSRDARIRPYLQSFVRELAATQDPDGYLGPFPRDARLLGPGLWDVWGHYHNILGLLHWHEHTGDRTALQTATRAADLICRTFLDGPKRVRDAGSEEMNQAIAHGMSLLYQRTGEPRYLRMAREVEKDWETPPAGDYVRVPLSGKAFYEGPKPRWESLHAVQSVAELYYLTGDDRYRRAFEQTWWSIAEGDRHNTGGFSSGEKATGNPYDRGAIETCCTVAWMALSVDMLRLSGNSLAADELELSTLNGATGAQHPSGRWWTYNTPMDGDRKASAHEIVFQARAGSPELNCCSVNGPRTLGLLSEWGLMEHAHGVALNYYGPSTQRAHTPGGQVIAVRQETEYPVDGRVRITLALERPERFVLRLRVPRWSEKTSVRISGRHLAQPQPGQYLEIEREWKNGDRIDLGLDLCLHAWIGERESAGHASIYRGPLLLTYDPRYGTLDPTALPALDLAHLTAEPAKAEHGAPWLILATRAADGSTIPLCDFASAGAAGNLYRSWLPVASAPAPLPFTRENPLRTRQV